MQAMIKDAFNTCLQAGRQTILQVVILAFAVMVVIIAGLFIQHEMSFDTLQPDHQYSYRVNIDFPNIDYGGTALAVSPGALRDVFSSSRFQEQIVTHTQISATPANYKLFTADKELLNTNLLAIDEHFSELFTVKSESGSINAPRQVNGLFISPSLARKIWNRTDVIGNVLYLNKKHPLVIEGIIAEQQQNSHLQFDALFNKAMIERLNPEFFQFFQMNNFYNYLKIKQDADISTIEQQLSEELSERNDMEVVVSLQPISDIYLSTGIHSELGESGSLTVLLVLGAIAAVVLMIGLSNTSSIQAAMVNGRWQEVAIRRLCGASGKSLLSSFLCSVLMTCLLAVLVALIFSELFLPLLSQWLGKSLLMPYSITTLLLLLTLTVLMTVACAIYPAWLLNSQSVKSAFANKQQASFRSHGLRRIVVSVQLIMTCVLLALCLSLNQYLNRMQQADLGYRGENRYLFDISAANKDVDLIEFISARGAAYGLTHAAEGEVFPSYKFNIGAQQLRVLDDRAKSIDWVPLIGVSEQYFDLLTIEIAEGRGFTESRQGDRMRYNEESEIYRGSVVINEAMRETLGWSDNRQALNQALTWGPDGVYRGQVIGVSQNVFYGKPTESAEPMMFILGRNNTRENYLAMSFSQTLTAQQLQALKNDINQTFGFKDMQLVNLREHYQALFKDEVIQFRLILIISFILLLSALAGVFGLLTLDTDSRRKELAIRRVLGASALRLCGFFWGNYSVMLLYTLGVSAIFYWGVITLLSHYQILNLTFSLLSFSGAYLVIFIFVSLVIVGRSHWTMREKPNKILRSL